MNTKHTPGPWAVEDSFATSSGLAVRTLIKDQPWIVAVVKHCPAPDFKQTNIEADAALIASAPDLLAALEMILNPSPHYGATQAHRDHIAAARAAGLAAIAKAKGTAA